MGELQEEYGTRVDFVIVPAEETAHRGEELAAFGFTEARHGLVAFTADGVPLVKLPGHELEKEEIRAAVEEVLAASGGTAGG